MKSGLAAQLDLTPLKVVARRLRVSRQRVQQIERTALEKLRQRPEMWDLLELAMLQRPESGACDLFARTPDIDWVSLREIPPSAQRRK